MSKQEIVEVLSRHFDDAFNNAMLEIEEKENIKTGDCDPWTAVMVSAEIENDAEHLAELAQLILAWNR